MILLDTSAWIEHLRGRSSLVDAAVERVVLAGVAAVTEPVLLELYAGARDAGHLLALRRMLGACRLLAVGGADTYEAAAELYRACRRGGFTPRGHVDCLIAAVAIRECVPVLHVDRDYPGIARRSALQLAPV